MLVENFSYVTPVAIRSAPQRRYDAWLKPAFREIYRVLRGNRFCVSFYSWKKADKFLAAWREAGFRTAGHPTFVEVRANLGTQPLFKKRRLPANLLARLDFRLRRSTPEIAEQLDRRRPISRVVIICKSQNHDAALVDFL